MELLRVHLFGGFLLERGGIALPPIASRAGRSLFAYLVMHRDRPLNRELVAGTFWPELSETRARRRLSHTLWQIQDVVNTSSSSYLDAATDTLAFDANSAYWLDVEEFDRQYAVAQGSPDDTRIATSYRASVLRTCVELYRGDFLAGFFDDWVVAEQDHYRQRYMTALSRLIEATKSAGAYEEALGYARRMTHHDPLSEEAHREVMRLCFLLGRTGDAVEQYRRCRSVLEDDLGADPSPATVELYEKIVRQRRAGIRVGFEESKPALSMRSDSPFVGREDERRLLIDAVERVLAGPGGVALIEGEPGVGKTRLANEVVDDAKWRGFEVSWGSCRPGALRPFAPVVEILESLTPIRLEQLAEQVAPIWFNQALRLAPQLAHRLDGSEEPAPLRPAEELTRTQEALVHTLGALGRIAPHLLVIDDVQWADRDTLSVLTQLASRLAGTRVLVLAVFRSEEARGEPEVWDVIRDLDRVAGLGRAVLSPLSVFELDEMVRRILEVPRLDPSVATRLHRETGGNALFALETLLAMRDRGRLEGGNDLLAGLEPPITGKELPVAPRVRAVIESRISLLGDEVAEVYQVASVIGDPVRLELLEAAAELARPVILDAVDELLHRGLLREVGNSVYRLAHDQIRQVAYEAIASDRRERTHLAIAESLIRLDADQVEEIGHHFLMGGDYDRSARYLLRAGLRAVELSAFATAASHLQEARLAAIDAGWSDADRYALLGHLEDVLGVLGRRQESSAVIDEMEDLVDAVTEPELARRRSWLLAHEGRLSDAEEMAARSVALEEEAVSADLADSLVALGTIRRWSGRPLEAVSVLEDAVDAAGDNERLRARALTELASTLFALQRHADATPLLEQAASIHERLIDLRGQAEVGGIRARALGEQGRRDEAQEQYSNTIELCRRIGYRHGEGMNLVNLANLHQRHGNALAALEGYDRAAVIFKELNNPRGEAVVLANAASARHSILGDDQRAKEDAQRAMGLFEGIGDLGHMAQCEEILAGITARSGDLDKALSMIEHSLRRLEGVGDVALEVQHLRSLALVELELGDYASAMAAVDRAEQLAADVAVGDIAVDLWSVRGIIAIARGNTFEGLTEIRHAVERLGPGVERQYLIHHRHARAAHAAGEREEARLAAMRASTELENVIAGLDAEARRQAIEMVPEHRSIDEWARFYSPSTIDVALPATVAPMGRRLEPEEMVELRWTIEHPDDRSIEEGIDRRRHRLMRLLDEAGAYAASPSVEDLARALGVSASTVRRDIAQLRRSGHDVRTRGQRNVS
ncbi:MAG TPA: BTAD domain-containing putative transcriptional regulator [Acidimicrobiia bacterium]